MVWRELCLSYDVYVRWTFLNVRILYKVRLYVVDLIMCSLITSVLRLIVLINIRFCCTLGTLCFVVTSGRVSYFRVWILKTFTLRPVPHLRAILYGWRNKLTCVQIRSTQYDRIGRIGYFDWPLIFEFGPCNNWLLYYSSANYCKSSFLFLPCAVVGSKRQVEWACLAQQLAPALSMPYFHYWILDQMSSMRKSRCWDRTVQREWIPCIYYLRSELLNFAFY